MGTDNISKRKIPVMLDKERHLFYSMGGLIFLTEKYGDPNEAIKRLRDKKHPAEALRVLLDLLYAGFIHEDKSITVEYLADNIDSTALDMLVRSISQALAGSMPEGSGDPQ